MHSQQLINQIKANLYSDPQKCIKLVSNKQFLNNMFQQHIVQLTKMLESNLQKMNKQNKNISFSEQKSQKSLQQLNFQLIICMYSIIIMKSTSSPCQQVPIFSSKLALQTLTKIYRQLKHPQLKKIVSGLLLKIPNFTNFKVIIKDLDPLFVTDKQMQKSIHAIRNQCPNLLEEKLLQFKHTEWGDFLANHKFSIDQFLTLINKLNTNPTSGVQDANDFIVIKQEIKAQYQFLQRRIKLIKNQQVFLYQFCDKFSQVFRLKLDFPKSVSQIYKNGPIQGQRGKTLPSYTQSELKLKIMLQARNYLYKILMSLIKKLSSYWSRKQKWLYDFISERIQLFGLQQLGLANIQQPLVYVQKLGQLQLLIKLSHVYYLQFGCGLFPSQKLQSLLFTKQYSFYKLIQCILYNQYEFEYKSQNSRIVSYQKVKKVNEENKNRNDIVHKINVNSKSLNINVHYDLLLQKVLAEIIKSQGNAYKQVRNLLNQTLRFFLDFYKQSRTFFYGGQLIAMIENAKNSEIIIKQTSSILKQIKQTLYPKKSITRQGLQFFCQQVFLNQLQKRNEHQIRKKLNFSSNLTITRTTYMAIHPQTIDPQKTKQKQPIKKTKSYDMSIEGWNQIQVNGNDKKLINQSQIFYSIKECHDELSIDKANAIVQEQPQVLEQDDQNLQNLILTPDF